MSNDPRQRVRVEVHRSWFGHREKFPCPNCGGGTLATWSKFDADGHKARRVCADGHNSEWLDGRCVRETFIPEPRTRVCIYPDCGKPTERMSRLARGRGRNSGGDCRLCQGHSKQAERYGRDALKPLLPNRGGYRPKGSHVS